MNLGDIAAFVAVAETGSINRAARRLNLTQPAMTRRVQNFEAAMGGAALLNRAAKPPVLTPAGRQALEHCRRVLKAVADLAARAEGLAAGELRVGLAPGLAEVVLSTPFDDLRQDFPDLLLRLSTQWTGALIEDVRNGGLDCALGLLVDQHVLPPAVQAATLGVEDIVVVAPRGARTARRLADLAPWRWVLNPPGCGYRLALQRACDRGGLVLDIAAEVAGRDLQMSLIARGMGLGLVPRRQVAASAHRRDLRILAVEDFRLEATVALLHGPALGLLGPGGRKAAGRRGHSARLIKQPHFSYLYYAFA